MRPDPSVSIPCPARSGRQTTPPSAISTGLLFRGAQEVLISHNGDRYRLRITRNGKLILTK